MKQKDIAMIILFAAIAAFASFILSNKLFASSTDRVQQAEVVDAVSTRFDKPSTKYFNDNSIDPTQLITIGDGSNANPFAAQQ